MQNRLLAVRTQNDHPAILAGRLSDIDLAEISVLQRSPVAVLSESYRLSAKCWSGFYQEKLRIICGVGALIAGEDSVGCAWLLGTGGYKKFAKSFLRLSHALIEEMHEIYPVLMNYVYEENNTSRGWLEYVGFEPLAKINDFMGSGKTFIHYQKENK